MNRPTLLSTTFVDMSVETSYGYRLFDDYGQTYCNIGSYLIEDDLELLQFAMENSDDYSRTLFKFLIEDQKGLNINNSWYDFDEIKHILGG